MQSHKVELYVLEEPQNKSNYPTFIFVLNQKLKIKDRENQEFQFMILDLSHV